MKPITGSVNKYIWPADEDQEAVPENEILCRIANAPVPINSRHFSLSNADYEITEEKMKKYLSMDIL